VSLKQGDKEVLLSLCTEEIGGPDRQTNRAFSGGEEVTGSGIVKTPVGVKRSNSA